MSRVLKGLLIMAVLLVAASVANAQPTSISVDSKAQITADGTAVNVTGFIVCPSGETFDVTAIVLQNHAGTSTTAAGSSPGETDCAGIPQGYSVLATVLLPANGQLKPGPANLLLQSSTTPGGSGPLISASIKLSN